LFTFALFIWTTFVCGTHLLRVYLPDGFNLTDITFNSHKFCIPM
jgi:hypothetical protein